MNYRIRESDYHKHMFNGDGRAKISNNQGTTVFLSYIETTPFDIDCKDKDSNTRELSVKIGEKIVEKYSYSEINEMIDEENIFTLDYFEVCLDGKDFLFKLQLMIAKNELNFYFLKLVTAYELR